MTGYKMTNSYYSLQLSHLKNKNKKSHKYLQINQFSCPCASFISGTAIKNQGHYLTHNCFIVEYLQHNQHNKQ